MINTITHSQNNKNETYWCYGHSYAKYNENPNKKDPKFKVGGDVRNSKYKNIFAKGYTPNWSEDTVPWTYVIKDLNGEGITGSFYEKELQQTNQKEFRIGKVVDRKGDKLYVKWKGYDNRFKLFVKWKGYDNCFNS